MRVDFGRLAVLAVCVLGIAVASHRVGAQEITVINPGGEEYETLLGAKANVPLEGIDPLSQSGWQATHSEPGALVEAIPGNANSGGWRISTGSNSTVPPEDVVLYQVTDHVVAADQQLILSFFGRGFFEFGNDVDAQTSLFGYVDGGGSLVQVDTLQHDEVVTGVWNPFGHTLNVPSESPLIGENLAIGFFTNSLDGAAFSSVDDVSLLLGTGGAPCDADNSGVCDINDAQLIADNFLEMVDVGTLGDMDNNGRVDFADFRVWKDATGSGASLAEILGTAVPEPATAWLAAAAFALLWRDGRGNCKD